MRYTVACGGSFDHFHVGHESLLRKAFEVGDRILIGICTDEMVKNKKVYHLMDKFEARKRNVERFAERFSKTFETFPLDDSYGLTIEEEQMNAIVATPRTEIICEEINTIRKSKGWHPLKIHKIQMVYSDDCRDISSTRIRLGEIDREGKVLVDYRMTDEVRQLMREPWGELIEGSNETEVAMEILKRTVGRDLISVGDVVTNSLLKGGYKPRNVIIDGKAEKESFLYRPVLELYEHNFTIGNPSGTISKDVWSELKDALRVESAIFVNGEEDVMVTPAGLIADYDTVIAYGMPNQGAVMMEVDVKMKDRLRMLLSKFNTVKG